MLTKPSIFRYVWLHFCWVYQEAGKLNIASWDALSSKISIPDNGMTFFMKEIPFPEPAVLHNWGGTKIPVFFSDSQIGEIITKGPDSVRIHFDLFSAAFYLLSGWQEFYSEKRDQFGRFPYKGSVQHTYNFVTFPVVNYYFDILKTALEKAYGILLKTPDWHGKPFVTFLSHDIDRLESGWKIEGIKQLIAGNYKTTLLLIKQKISGKDHLNNLETVVKTVKKYGAVSTFFWLAQKGNYQNHPNADYDITEKKYQELMQKLDAEGFENGIHGSFGTSTDLEQLKQEISKTGCEITGNRFHYLCFDPKTTSKVLENSGLKYDSSLGYAEHFGFRNSYCFPFYPFNFEKAEPCAFLEIPLNLMDATLWHPNYLQIPPGEIVKAIEPMLREVKKFGGIFSLLWHNENFSEYNTNTGLQVFEAIMKKLSDLGSQFMTGDQIDKVFRQKFSDNQ